MLEVSNVGILAAVAKWSMLRSWQRGSVPRAQPTDEAIALIRAHHARWLSEQKG
jgi:hypothetical protein